MPHPDDIQDLCNHAIENEVVSSDEFYDQSVIASDDGWPAPNPLVEFKTPQPFPLDALPEAVRNWAEAVAKNTQTAEDLPASLAMAVLASAVAGKVHLQINNDWREQLALYLVAFLGAGETKSPVLRKAIAPCVEHESRLRELASEAVAAKRIERYRLDAQLRQAKAQLLNSATTDHKASALVLKLEERLESTRKSQAPQTIVADLTSEGLVRGLYEQDERLSLFTAEADFLETLSTPKDWNTVLKCYDGELIRVNRAHRDAVVLDMPTLCIGAAVQPIVLRKLLAKREFIERGGLGRFVLINVPSRVGKRSWEHNPVPMAVTQRYNKTVRALLEIGVERNGQGRLNRHILTFDRAAADMLVQYRNELEPCLDPTNGSGLMAFLLKQPGRVARIAGILNLAEQGGLDCPVRTGDMQKAIQISEYFRAHAEAIYGDMGVDAATQLAKQILSTIVKNGLPRITKRLCNETLRPDCSDVLD